jgi:hypothetical protein
VIFAEGAAAETFVDCGSRGIFHNASEFAQRYPDDGAPRWTFCAPVVERGRKLAAIQRKLARRALEAGIGVPQDGPVQGALDRAEAAVIAGWAWQDAHPGVPVRLEVLVDGVCVAEPVANRYRADLEAAGYGDGRCSFELRLPHPLSPFSRHEIIVRRASDGMPLGDPLVIFPERSLSRSALADFGCVLGAARRTAATVAEADALLQALLAEVERVRQARLDLLEPRAGRRPRRGGDARSALGARWLSMSNGRGRITTPARRPCCPTCARCAGSAGKWSSRRHRRCPVTTRRRRGSKPKESPSTGRPPCIRSRRSCAVSRIVTACYICTASVPPLPMRGSHGSINGGRGLSTMLLICIIYD